MSCGKKIRLARLFHRVSGRSLIVPMDHGASIGPVEGLSNMGMALGGLRASVDAIQGLVLHRGAMRHLDDCISPRDLPPRILHVSSSTLLNPAGGLKSQVACVEDALQMGADALSVHVNLGVEGEGAMMRDFGALASACQRWGMPLMSMMYVRSGGQVSTRLSDIKLAARVAAETGADLVKVSYPGSVDAMHEVVNGCFAPVLIAGGERSVSPRAVLQTVRAALAGGAAGICIGRNVFQADAPAEMLDSLVDLVHAGGPLAVDPIHRRNEALAV